MTMLQKTVKEMSSLVWAPETAALEMALGTKPMGSVCSALVSIVTDILRTELLSSFAYKPSTTGAITNLPLSSCHSLSLVSKSPVLNSCQLQSSHSSDSQCSYLKRTSFCCSLLALKRVITLHWYTVVFTVGKCLRYSRVKWDLKYSCLICILSQAIIKGQNISGE